MNAAKKTILLLWLVIAASVANVSALTPGATENRTWEKSFTALESRQAQPQQTAGRHQENGNAAYDFALDSLLAAESSVWDLSPLARGTAIEEALGANLPHNFPVIDIFDFATGTATSIKSIDLTAASYQEAAALAGKLNGYVDSVAGFNGANWANVNISASQITARQLQLAIQPGSASAAQQAVINAGVARAQGKGVNLIVTAVP